MLLPSPPTVNWKLAPTDQIWSSINGFADKIRLPEHSAMELASSSDPCAPLGAPVADRFNWRVIENVSVPTSVIGIPVDQLSELKSPRKYICDEGDGKFAIGYCTSSVSIHSAILSFCLFPSNTTRPHTHTHTPKKKIVPIIEAGTDELLCTITCDFSLPFADLRLLILCFVWCVL